MMKRSIVILTITLLAVAGWATAEEDIFDQVSHHYADNDGVKLHYVTNAYRKHPASGETRTY